MTEERALSGSGGILGPAANWIRKNWRALLSEVFCTLFLVSLSITATIPGPERTPVPLVYSALATGCLIAANVAAFGEFSGAHMNPALTLSAVLAGHMSPALGIGYALSQCVGSTLGFLILASLVPDVRVDSFGLILPSPGVSPLIAMCYETLLTCMVMLVVCSMLSYSTPNPVIPVNLGVAVVAVILAGASMSGACINPARSLAPAIFHNNWKHQWVYWVGPLGGACLAVGIRRILTTPQHHTKVPAKPTESEPEEVILQGKP